MVKPSDLSSDNEQADQTVRKHTRVSSSDQAKQSTTNENTLNKTIEHGISPASPRKSKTTTSERPQTRQRKSSTSTKHKTRPAYSRRYSTPPSRPLSPSGYPQMLESDMIIPEIDLNQANQHFLQVDSAPQEPDLWDDPETDYFSTIEGPAGKHARGKSRRQLSQNVNASNSLNAMMAGNANGLQQISEDQEPDLRIPGGFAA